jgi:hypothetical protein
MDQLFLFHNSVKREPAIEIWMKEHSGELGDIALNWFEIIRQCGNDVRELMHDGYPTACVSKAAFAYVGAFKAHVNIGFFRGAQLSDPTGLLEGTGKYMRHVKIRPGTGVDAKAMKELIDTAYSDMKSRINGN